MSYKPLSTSNSQETNYNQLNDMIRDLNAQEQIKIFKDDSGIRRVLLGKGADGFYGLKVSKEGQDVYTAADIDLVFNSDRKTLRLAADPQTFSHTTSAHPSLSSESFTIAHGLSYTPMVLASVQASSLSAFGLDNLTPLPAIALAGVGGSTTTYQVAAKIEVYADDTDITFRWYYGDVSSDAFATTYSFVYVLLEQPFSLA